VFQIVAGAGHLLHGVGPTRQIEVATQHNLPFNTLMQRAGLAAAQLALAVAPHAQRIWIACGPGNNGGDGLETAVQLLHLGKRPTVTWLGSLQHMPADTAAAHQRALAAGVDFANEPDGNFDLCVDALLGIGAQARKPTGRMADWIRRMNTSAAPVLSIDIPSGVNADTGAAAQSHVKATHTLSLLTLKPGLFTAQGRDASGVIWLDALGTSPDSADSKATATLITQPALAARPHSAHKGVFGDVAVIGGAPGMSGAALLAATAALHAGAGRVFVGLLGDQTYKLDMYQPELMFRSVQDLTDGKMTVVCGCGGGTLVQAQLPVLLASESAMVLDADALNAIAQNDPLQTMLTARSARQLKTVLTPHPLEAARLLDSSTQQVQADRLAAAQTLSQRFGCTVVLKGSGTVVSSPGQLHAINPTGNARLATAGTGDVLAGMIGARLASGQTAFDAACHAVYAHGAMADAWPPLQALTAGQLACCRYAG